MGGQKRHNFTLTFDSVGAGWRKIKTITTTAHVHFAQTSLIAIF